MRRNLRRVSRPHDERRPRDGQRERRKARGELRRDGGGAGESGGKKREGGAPAPPPRAAAPRRGRHDASARQGANDARFIRERRPEGGAKRVELTRMQFR